MGPEFPFLGFYFTSCYESVRHLYVVDPMLKGGREAELRGERSDKDQDCTLASTLILVWHKHQRESQVVILGTPIANEEISL